MIYLGKFNFFVQKSHDLHVNQIVVKIDGWNRLSAVSVDKVGVYFRVAEPDKKSDTGLNSVSFSYDAYNSKEIYFILCRYV